MYPNVTNIASRRTVQLESVFDRSGTWGHTLRCRRHNCYPDLNQALLRCLVCLVGQAKNCIGGKLERLPDAPMNGVAPAATFEADIQELLPDF